MNTTPPNCIQSSIRLAPYTTWKIGGVADYFSLPETREALIECIQWADTKSIPFAILGRGSNVLIDDDGFRGLVICLRNLTEDPAVTIIENDYAGRVNKIEVSAGVSLPRLAKIAAGFGWTDYEFLIGIPGTVGGALFMNAGYKLGEKEDMAHLCESVKLISSDGTVVEYTYKDLNPSYRKTSLHGDDQKRIIISAQFKAIGYGDKDEIRKSTGVHLAMRKKMQPLSVPTAGSVFKGLPDGRSAALLIDQAGLKGLSVGGARVSPKHANWIENYNNATAVDVETLITIIKDKVFEQFAEKIEAEIQRLK